MDKKRLLIIIAAVVAVGLLVAVFAGLTSGKDAGQNGDYKKPNSQTTETTTGETTEPDGTAAGNESGSGEGNDSQGGGNQGGITATEQGDIRIEIEENGDLVIPGPTQSSDSTDSKEDTQEQQDTKPTGNKTELEFSGFWTEP